MNKTKRLISIILSLAMVFQVLVFAPFAMAEDEETVEIIFTEEELELIQSRRAATNKIDADKRDFDRAVDVEGAAPNFLDYAYFSSSVKSTFNISQKQSYNGTGSLLTKIPADAGSEESHFPHAGVTWDKTLVASAMVLGTKANAGAVAANPKANLYIQMGAFFTSFYWQFGEGYLAGATSRGNSVLLSDINKAPASTDAQTAVSKDDWKMVHTSGVLPTGTYSTLWSSCAGVISTAKDVEFYVDDYYMGELEVVLVKNTTPETIYMPYEEESATVKLTAKAINQLGNSEYFDGATPSTYTWEIIDLPEGVTLEGDSLKVLRTAKEGQAKLKVTFNPTFVGADSQTAEQTKGRTANITLNIAVHPETPMEPIVKDVVILGDVANGNELIVDYYYWQVRGFDDASIIKWYKKLPDAESWGEPFLEGTKETAGKYTVGTNDTETVKDEDHFIMVTVTPTTDSDPAYTAADVPSEPAFKPTAPISIEENIKVEGTPITGETWIVTDVGFFDINDKDKESKDEHKYQWYTVENGVRTAIDTPDAKDKDYTIRDVDANKYIQVGIIVASDAEDETKFAENEAFSKPMLCSATPTVSNITFDKTSNSYLTVSYDYNHPFNILENRNEDGTVIEWYNENDELVETGDKIKITNYNGETLTVKITPKAVEAPFEGETESEEYEVSIKSAPGGSGPSYSSGPVFKPEKPIVTTPEPTTLINVPDWAKAEVDFVIANKIMEPFAEGDFGGSEFIDRKEFMSAILKAAGIEKSDYRGEFGDVSSMDGFSGLLQAAVDKNIISKADLFYPERSLTRDEMCKIITASVKAVTSTEIKAGDITLFNDALSIQQWARTYIADALGLGLVKGYETGNFLPKGTVTRSETAVIAKRIADFIKANGGDGK